MGLEKVKQEILDKAREEASRLVEEARQEARAVMKAAEKQVQEYERLMADDIKRSVEITRRRELASAELELQKKVLAAKNGLIGSVFSAVRKKLEMLSDRQRELHARVLLDLARKEIGGTDIAVAQCNSRDAKFLNGSGLGGGKFKVERDDRISGGVVAESPDGKLRVDYSYESILEKVSSKVLSDVAKLLFGK